MNESSGKGSTTIMVALIGALATVIAAFISTGGMKSCSRESISTTEVQPRDARPGIDPAPATEGTSPTEPNPSGNDNDQTFRIASSRTGKAGNLAVTGKSIRVSGIPAHKGA